MEVTEMILGEGYLMTCHHIHPPNHKPHLRVGLSPFSRKGGEPHVRTPCHQNSLRCDRSVDRLLHRRRRRDDESAAAVHGAGLSDRRHVRCSRQKPVVRRRIPRDLKATPHNSPARSTATFVPSISCIFLDLPPVNLRNLQLHLSKNSLAS